MLSQNPQHILDLVPTITAKKSLLVESLLSHKDEILKAIQVLDEGHINIVLPQQMKQNINSMRQAFGEYNIEPSIFISHKPSKSNALIKQACAENVGLDVSSKNELISALKNGFQGDNICCTGSKNDEYISLSIQHDCLHSVDSIEELERYIVMHEIMMPHKKRNILLRVNSADAPYSGKISRFGIPLGDIDNCFKILKETTHINLEGFHIHSGEANADLRSDELVFLLELMQKAYAEGFAPKILDMGGSLPHQLYSNMEECDVFIQGLINQMNGGASITWRNYCYDIEIAQNGSVIGQEKLKSQFRFESLKSFAHTFLSKEVGQSRLAFEVINECDFTLALEPGASAYDQCGITLFKVTGTRANTKGEHMTILDGNVFNLSFNIMEYMSDPILISKDEESLEGFSTYLVGNLCADFDVMVKRKVVLKGKPKAGDYLCFVNTAGYTADFHDAPIHQHPMGQKIVALKKGDDWQFMSEDRFNPYFS